MTTLTWIYIGAGVAFAFIALSSFFMMRKMRGKLTRQALPIFVSQLVIWTFFGFSFFNGVISTLYLATVAVIFVPTIITLLRLPKDNPAA